MQKPADECRLTVESLQRIRSLGFQYFLIKGYAPGRKADYIELGFFTLVPVVELPIKQEEMEIYAPIDSEIVDEWASQKEGGVQAFIEGYPHLFEK